jgi:hypothetical protein
MSSINLTDEQYYLGPDGQWNSNDENYGNYQFTSIKDIINNFIISYVGEDKIISKVKRTDVAFHAQRGIQEFSFDILPSVKSQEIEIGPTLNFILPKDYVNYVKVVWVDSNGIERIVYPASKTSNPTAILQDDSYQYLFDTPDGQVIEANESETRKRFQSNGASAQQDLNSISNSDIFNHGGFGRRYGLTPEHAQSNGVFYIDPLAGIIYFDSSFVGRIVTLKYISDGLASDEMTVHKFAEEALYKYIAHAILATRANTPEYLVMRFKKERSAARRNAKLRLSNIKIEEITQVMRNKSKQIKH